MGRREWKFKQIATETDLLLLASEHCSIGNCSCDSPSTRGGVIFTVLFKTVIGHHRGRIG